MLGIIAAAALTTLGQGGWNDLNRNGQKDVYEDPAQPVERRVEDLLGKMTPDEKVGQLRQPYIGQHKDAEIDAQLKQGQIGSFLSIPPGPALHNQLQRVAVEQSRLGIPFINGYDSIHGYRTVFPIPLAQACAWEPGLFERTSAISARETAADGIDWAFAPMVDLARDPRWGRIAEGFGEDPWLGARDAAACVRGFQGADPAAPDRVAACLKHYIGYGAAEGGRDYNTTEISDFTLRNFYLPQYRAGVEAGALTVMSAFNCLNGVPASGNRRTLTDILRGELGFQGFVVSDWESVSQTIDHGVAADAPGAARLALHAGVDMEMTSATYTNLPALVAQGALTQAEVDEAVRRVLRVKIRRGLFERPYADEKLAVDAFLKPDARALAREAAVKSCVLLKNDGGVLPLARTVRKIALIGPLGAEQGELLGCWAGRGEPKDAISLEQGLRAKLGQDVQLTVVKGCELIEAKRTKPLTDGTPGADEVAASGGAGGFAEAVAAAQAADVVLFAGGEPRGWSGEEDCRSELGLTGRQAELFARIAATGKPVVAILFSGRPLAVPQVYAQAAAVLQAWHPGVEGGPAVAELLLGDASPAGRLTVSIPRAVGQVPVHYNHLNTGRPTMGLYKDLPRTPQFPFGFGLTYTTFAYGPVKLDSARLRAGGRLTATAAVRNTGARPGEEVAQLYLRDRAASAGARPVRELKGFEKIRLAPGESRDVRFTVTEQELGYSDAQGKWLVEPGAFQLWIAPDAASGAPADFVLE